MVSTITRLREQQQRQRQLSRQRQLRINKQLQQESLRKGVSVSELQRQKDVAAQGRQIEKATQEALKKREQELKERSLKFEKASDKLQKNIDNLKQKKYYYGLTRSDSRKLQTLIYEKKALGNILKNENISFEQAQKISASEAYRREKEERAARRRDVMGESEAKFRTSARKEYAEFAAAGFPVTAYLGDPQAEKTIRDLEAKGIKLTETAKENIRKIARGEKVFTTGKPIELPKFTPTAPTTREIITGIWNAPRITTPTSIVSKVFIPSVKKIDLPPDFQMLSSEEDFAGSGSGGGAAGGSAGGIDFSGSGGLDIGGSGLVSAQQQDLKKKEEIEKYDYYSKKQEIKPIDFSGTTYGSGFLFGMDKTGAGDGGMVWDASSDLGTDIFNRDFNISTGFSYEKDYKKSEKLGVWGWLGEKTPDVKVPLFSISGATGMKISMKDWTESFKKEYEKQPTPQLKKKIPEFEKKYDKYLKPNEMGALVFTGTEKAYNQYSKDYDEIQKLYEASKGWEAGATELTYWGMSKLPASWGQVGLVAGSIFAGSKILGVGATLISKAPHAVQVAGKTAMVGADVYFGYKGGKAVLDEDLPASQRIIGGGVAGLSALSLGAMAYPKVSGYMRTFGREKIPIAKLTPEEVLLGRKIFPESSYGSPEQIAKAHKKLFESMEIKLPTQTKPAGFHAAGDIFWTGKTAEIGEAPLHISSAISPRFLKITGEGAKPSFSLFSPFKKPGVLQVTPEKFEVNIGFEVGRGKGYKWTKPTQTGIAYLPGAKKEIQAILETGTQLEKTGKQYYSTYGGVRFPIDEFKVLGKGKQMSNIDKLLGTDTKLSKVLSYSGLPSKTYGYDVLSGAGILSYVSYPKGDYSLLGKSSLSGKSYAPQLSSISYPPSVSFPKLAGSISKLSAVGYLPKASKLPSYIFLDYPMKEDYFMKGVLKPLRTLAPFVYEGGRGRKEKSNIGYDVYLRREKRQGRKGGIKKKKKVKRKMITQVVKPFESFDLEIPLTAIPKDYSPVSFEAIENIRENLKKGKKVAPKPLVKAKLTKVNPQPLSKEDALNLASYDSDNTLNRQFKIVKTKGEPQKPTIPVPSDYWRRVSYKFRPFKIKKKEKKPFKQIRFIEKKEYALDTWGEKQRIMSAKLIAAQKQIAQEKLRRQQRFNQLFNFPQPQQNRKVKKTRKTANNMNKLAGFDRKLSRAFGF